MKRILILAISIFLLVMPGCSSKQVDVSATTHPLSQAVSNTGSKATLPSQ